MRLLSFLGRVPKTEQGYRKTQYEFSDGTKTELISFIGWSLIERLKPDSVVILGTSGSMWDHLLDSMSHQVSEALHLGLIEQVEAKKVSQDLLDQLQSELEGRLGIPCHLVIIPYGRDMAEQIQIMELIAHHVPENAKVALDVTHGFRHLPMLGLVSAQYLQWLKGADIRGIYYGMYDPDQRLGEVYDLKGLLQLNGWVFALSQFDKDGDYGVFSDALRQDGFSPVAIKALEKAAFFERTFNVANARQQLSTFKRELGNALPGAGRLFTQALKDRVEWSNSNNLQAHQRKLARFYLDNGDFVRAAVFGVEAFLSSLMRSDEQKYDYYVRNMAEKAFRDGRRGDSGHHGSYEQLKAIRNALAHGTAPDENVEYSDQKKTIAKEAREMMQDTTKLEQHLRQLFNRLGI